jgi:Zn-dependent M28 family amino/carboxypeptidase
MEKFIMVQMMMVLNSGIIRNCTSIPNGEKAGNGPKRSILFLHVTGEEHGLHGSRYSENPLFPFQYNTDTDISI